MRRIDLDFSQSRQKGSGQEAAHLQQQAKETQRRRQGAWRFREREGRRGGKSTTRHSESKPGAKAPQTLAVRPGLRVEGKESRGDDRRRTLIIKDILPSTTRSANTGDHSLTYPQGSKIEQRLFPIWGPGRYRTRG